MAAELPPDYTVVRDNETYFLGHWERNSANQVTDLKLLKDREQKPVAFSSYKEAAAAANAQTTYAF